MTQRITSGIHIWQSYWGGVLHDGDDSGASLIYGFENQPHPHKQNMQADIPGQGACFGFVTRGRGLCYSGPK